MTYYEMNIDRLLQLDRLIDQTIGRLENNNIFNYNSNHIYKMINGKGVK